MEITDTELIISTGEVDLESIHVVWKEYLRYGNIACYNKTDNKFRDS